MENKLEKKYGLMTAISMVVGVVIGSGVFFKAEVVLSRTGGNMPLGILAWLIVGGIMVACSYVFAKMATHYDVKNGLVDFAENTLGKRYAYNLVWFTTVIYIPSLCAVLAWVSARYTCSLLGWDIVGGSCMTITLFYLCAMYAMNALSPKLAGKFQVTTTVIKMIPLVLMAVVGTVYGVMNGTLVELFQESAPAMGVSEALMSAVVSVAFAFDGWILATTINAELKDSKKNLPIALIAGALVVIATYVLYYIGINGAVSVDVLLTAGENAVRIAFTRLFGTAAGTLVFVIVIISCLGTLNGLMLACCRGFYSLASRNEGPLPEMFKQVDPYTNMPTNSAIAGLFLSGFWLLYFYGANLSTGWFGNFCFDNSEMSIVAIYAMYIPMFIKFMVNAKGYNFFDRVITPIAAVCGCVLMVYAAYAGYGGSVFVHFFIVFAVIMAIGNIFYKSK
ncbi:MAG: APC family permease [Erysipelotrichales bacterium]|nr:APC family permease [Erysipelotrichales bacterium]